MTELDIELLGAYQTILGSLTTLEHHTKGLIAGPTADFVIVMKPNALLLEALDPKRFKGLAAKLACLEGFDSLSSEQRKRILSELISLVQKAYGKHLDAGGIDLPKDYVKKRKRS
ncbi:MAG: hypothetical protein JW834_02325 [Candidatus Diapherotrites archaeon]|nr:hypothetical protein [Candidatus Diapherotrites archaeon]